MPRPTPRESLGLTAGYHSPQVDVRVRLNTNEAPEPPPVEFVEELTAAIADVAWNRYPDRAARPLRQKIAASEQALATLTIDRANVLVANGSNEVLQSVCLTYGGPGRSVLTIEPTYQLHSHIARITGTDVVQVERNVDFSIDLPAVVRAIGERAPSVVFVCSPNNPTGLIEDEATIRALLDAAENVGALLVVDEAYGQFARWSSLSLVDEDRPILVSRTFSKTWSMAGLRLGYAIGPRWAIEAIEAVLLPYHLDAVKQLAGELALDHGDAMVRRVASLVEERGRIMEAFSDMPLEFWPSESNFILFRPTSIDGDRVWHDLVDRSVMIRNCAGWDRLDGCLRVTVGTAAENNEFLAQLRDVLNAG